MVEGKDDQHVVMHICGAWKLGEIQIIKSYGGKDDLLAAIVPRTKESDIESLGILLDADTDLEARWTSIRTRLNGEGYNVPLRPEPDGTVIAPPADSILPKVGVWLMPDNRTDGILEHFLRTLVPDGDPLFEHVEESVRTLPANCRKYGHLDEPKVKIHTYLAWQAEPGRALGTAITARYLDPKLPSGAVFAQWLRRTFFE